MGKYRFKLSGMIPNAWFYKLKDMGKSRSTSLKSRNANRVKQIYTPTQTIRKGSNITKFQPPKSSPAYNNSSVSPAEPLLRFNDPLYSSPQSHGRPSNDCSYTSPRRSKRTTVYKQTNETIFSSDQPFCHSHSSSELNSPDEFITSKSNPRSSRSIEFLMFDELRSWSSSSLRSSCSCSCRISSSTADIIIDLKHHHNKNHEDSISRKFQKLNEFDAVSELELRPIQTKIPKEQNGKSDNKVIRQSVGKELHATAHNYSKFVTEVKKSPRSSSLLSRVELQSILTKIPKEQNFGKIDNNVIRHSAGKELQAIDHNNSKLVRQVKKSRRSSSLLSEVELRPILTKIPKEQNFGKIDNNVTRKSAGKEWHAIDHNNIKFVRQVKKSRRSSSLLSDSFVIIKSSLHPQRDFQDSMMEMIEENNIKGFKDLEELLACYLILNCKEYHPLIVKAFEQILLDVF